MTWHLVLAGLCLWTVGAAVDLLAGPRTLPGRTLPYLAGSAGGVCVCLAGVFGVERAATTTDLGSSLGVGQTIMHIDGLAGLFLTLTATLSVVISACMVSWTRSAPRALPRGTGAAYLLLLASVTVVIIAGDAFTFLFGWELLTVAFYLLVGARRQSRRSGRAAWVTFGVGKVGGAALLFAFLLLAGRTGSFSLSAWSHLGPGPVHAAAYALIIVGFGAKIGLIPLQVWMPIGYPAAPGPLRAALAGLAANAGVYGLWRFLAVLGRPPLWLAVAVLVVGGLTALLGIVFAGVQADINRVIAYSSVENGGLIAVGYGVAMAGSATSQPQLVAIGLLAASLQVLAHAVAKTSLFASAAFFTEDWGSDLLDELRGVGHTHRWMGSSFALGALTLSGLPPTIGFVSEWFLLEALMQEFRTRELELRLAMGLAGALVALTVGIAALTFVRLLGLTILGRPAGPPPERAKVHDGGLMGRTGLTVLAASCVGLATAAPWVVRYLATGLSAAVSPGVTRSALKSPWVLQPVYRDFSISSPSWLSIVLPIGFLSVAAGAVAVSRGRILRIRRVPAWRSATAGVGDADRYSSFGYANVLRHVLGNVLGAQREMVTVLDENDAGIVEVTHIEARSTVVEPFETYLYRPGRRALLGLAALAKRIQSGRLDAYVAYMLGALIISMIVVAAL